MEPSLRSRTQTWTTISILGALLVIGAVDWLGYRSLATTLTAGDWSRHALLVLQQAGVVLGELRDAETSQRGFLLTGVDDYLDPYRQAREKISGDLAQLEALAADQPDQQARLKQLEPLVRAKLDELAETIALRQSRGPEAALGVVRTHSGKRTMDRIRGLIDELMAEETAILQARLRSREHESDTTRLLLVAGNALAGILILASLVVLLRQMSRRERAQRRSRESEQRLRVTLSSIGDAVIATNTDGQVTFMNGVAVTLTGWSADEARGRPLHEVFVIINETTRRKVENPVERVLREGRVVGLANHTVLVRRDGQEHPIDDSAAPIRDAGLRIMGVVLVFRDVSARREMQATRERYVRAEAANEAKDEFLAVLSHELRSPLTAMLGWVRLMQKPDRTDEVVDRALSVLDRNIGIQTRLINELLDVSRIVSGQLQLELKPANLVTLVRQAVESIQASAAAKQLLVQYEPPQERALCVQADTERILQVLANILTNAVKFTPPGGRIEIALHRLDGAARVEVHDTGEGIAPDFLPHVFERFRQADSSRKRKHGGLGLGLAVVKHLAERHNGSVEARSAGPGLGATIALTLPLMADDALDDATESTAVEPGRLQRVTVLLVDDNSDTLDALRLALDESGAQVLAARSLAEALTQFDRRRPDVIVSDLSMPGGDGFELIRAIREREASHTPAIAMTGLASNSDRSAAIRAGFDEHLSKPIDPDALVSSVRLLALSRGMELRRGPEDR